MNQDEIMKIEQLIRSDYNNTAGIVIQRNGKLVYEKYFNECSAGSPVHIFSVTKSIISLLIGIAIDKKCIKGVDEKVVDFFPEYAAENEEMSSLHVTIKDLLTMTAPYKHTTELYGDYFSSYSWVKYSLDSLDVEDAAKVFRYTPIIGPDILSGILVRATGQSVFDFAADHLFGPLGIHVENILFFSNTEEQLAFYTARDISGWVAAPDGVNSAGWSLTLSCRDMAQIGQLYLNKGMWKDQRIVSSQWIDESTIEHSRWRKLNRAYGYLWWLLDDGEYAAMGDGGNVIYVNQKKDMVISIASYFVENAKDRIQFIKEYIEPLFEVQE